MGGKGDKQRPFSKRKWDQNFSRINWNKKPVAPPNEKQKK